MKKVAPFFALILSLPPALASSPLEGVGSFMFDLFEPVFGRVSLGDEYSGLLFKILIFFLLFAVIFYVLRFVFEKEGEGSGKRIRIVVALIISIIGTIGIPLHLVRDIVLSYTVVTIFFLVALPILAIGMLTHRVFHEENRFNRIAKAVLYGLVAWLISSAASMDVSELFKQSMSFESWLGFGQAICIILVIWNIIMAFSSGQPDTGEGAQRFWDWLANPPGRDGNGRTATPRPTPTPRQRTPPPPEINELQERIRRLMEFIHRFRDATRRLLEENHRHVLQQHQQHPNDPHHPPPGTPRNPNHGQAQGVPQLQNEWNALLGETDAFIIETNTLIREVLQNRFPQFNRNHKEEFSHLEGMWSAQASTAYQRYREINIQQYLIDLPAQDAV